MRDHIRFLVNGREHRVAGAAAFTTLANYLRYDAAATGTKIVCEEGDCGACTVLIRRGHGDFLPVNSCILSMIQLDAASIVTVEGLRMNPVQESMMANHGAQCGYCTPGFVVAMSALFETCDRVDEKQVRDGLTGNLCRCTGYEPIIKAALAAPPPAKKLRDMYPETLADDEPVRVDDFFAPTTLADAIAFKRDHTGCTIVQGATDVGVWINKRAFTAPAMLSLTKIPELDELRDDDGGTEEGGPGGARPGGGGPRGPPPRGARARAPAGAPPRGGPPPAPPPGSGATIVAGANVTLSAFEAFIKDRIPELHAILNIFGSPQIKNAGTLIGNIANGSPIGDTLPYLFVAGAELDLAGSDGTRTVAIADYYLGYKKFDLRADEIIVRVRVPVVPCHSERSEESPAAGAPSPSSGLGMTPHDILKLYKVSRRKDLDISAFTAAIRLRTSDGHINSATIAYGGVAPTVVRLPKTESFLAGKPISLDTFEEAGRIARGEVKPISDVRGSADYRAQLAENILPKFYFDAFGAA